MFSSHSSIFITSCLEEGLHSLSILLSLFLCALSIHVDPVHNTCMLIMLIAVSLHVSIGGMVVAIATF